MAANHVLDTEEGTAVDDRTVGAVRENQPGPQEAAQSVGLSGTRRPESGHRPVADLADEPALGDRHDTEPGKALEGLWRGDTAVLDAVTVVGPRLAPDRLAVAVDNEAHRGVADNVRRHLPSGEMRADDGPAEIVPRLLRVAAVPRVVVEAFFHPAPAPDQRPVREDLCGADAEPIVTEPGVEPGGQTYGPLQIVLPVSVDWFERIRRDHHGRADSQEAALACELLRGKLD